MSHGPAVPSLCLALGLALAVPRPAPAQRASLAGLDAWVGTWQVEAVSRATPFSRPGTTTAELSCDWTASRQFVVCESRISSGGETTTQLTVYGAADSGYVSYTIVPGG
jgi:hypothetical protein